MTPRMSSAGSWTSSTESPRTNTLDEIEIVPA
jgi:hypothetical protein